MNVRRFLAGVIVVGLGVPGIASASAVRFPWPRVPASAGPIPLPADNGVRVMARAEGPGTDAAASPTPTASPAPSPAPAGSSAPLPPPTADQTARARSEFGDFVAGRIDRTHYTGYANTQISDALVKQLGDALKTLGTVKSFVPLPTSAYQGLTVYQFVATCANGSIDELIAWDADGKIQFIFFRPPQAL